MSAVQEILYPLNSQFILMSGLQDQSVTPVAYVNTAVLTATLKDSSGASVPGATSMTGAYVAASNGNYRFPVDPTTFNPVPGSTYTLFVDGTYNSTVKFHAELRTKVAVRSTGTET